MSTSADTSSTTKVFIIHRNDSPISELTDSNSDDNVVEENSEIGTLVGITASATDDDATNSVVTYSLDDDAGGLFAIDETTGGVTVAGTIDREAADRHETTVLATSQDDSFSTASFTITVTDVNESTISAVTDSNAAANQVATNAELGSRVGIIASASDADATNSTVTYSLDDDADGLFAIDETSGVVTVAEPSNPAT